MDIVEFMAGLGAEGISADLQSGQIILFGFTLALFLASVVLCFQAFRAARGARTARADSANYVKAAEDIVSEMRQLSAQMEKASPRYSGVAEARADDDNTANDFGDPIDLRDEDSIDDEASSKNLGVAKAAATVPSSLLTGILRRR